VSKKGVGRVYIALLIAVFVGAVALNAQETRGQILGSVVDPTGAIVVGAAITAVNTGANVRTVASTNQSGDYVLPFLILGIYSVTVAVLDGEGSSRPAGPASGPERCARTDPQHEPRKSALGRTPHPRPIAQAGYRHRREQRGQVHGPRAEAAVADLADLP